MDEESGEEKDGLR